MIYHVQAGHLTWVLSNSIPDQDVEKLWQEFSSSVPKEGRLKYLKDRLSELAPGEGFRQPYLMTRVFIAWLCRSKGFEKFRVHYVVTEPR
jgi:hypothetical protein